MKVFKRGGFIILEDNSEEFPIPVSVFDYRISGDNITLRDTGENTKFSAALTAIQNEAGSVVGNATAIGIYLANLTESGSGSADSPSQQILTNPSSTVVSGWKKISFACSGAITATINSNAVVYPYTLGTSVILGADLEADTVTANDITFDGTGTVLLTVKQ
jgi:hypothetical protein